MRKKYSITLITTAGKTHKFQWTCDETKLGRNTPYDVFMQHPYVITKDSARSITYVCKQGIAEITFTERKAM